MFSEEGFQRLVDALERLHCSYSIHKVVPFVHTLEPEFTPAPGQRVVVMGTYTLVNLARERGWEPASFDDPNTFDYEVQNYHWPMLNGGQEGSAWKFAEVPEHRRPFFIRPVDDTKSFVGQVMDWPSFSKWRLSVLLLKPEDQPTITADTWVVIAPVREIWREYRLWVVDGEVVTASLYKFGTIKRYEEGAPHWIMTFARKQINEWVPSRAFVMDVAETAEGLKIIEVNNLNSAGFYKGDMQRLVAAIEGMK